VEAPFAAHDNSWWQPAFREVVGDMSCVTEASQQNDRFSRSSPVEHFHPDSVIDCNKLNTMIRWILKASRREGICQVGE
jgi:hypothetical protein